jgi:META domain
MHSLTGFLRLERFRVKWIPVRMKKTRQSKELEPGSDSIRTDKALAAVAMAVLAVTFPATPVRAEEGFPFGFEMRLETAPQPGSKRIPTLEIGDNGEATLDLWCKSGKGQFSVAGNTVIFVPGPMQDRSCPPARAQADDDLVAALGEAATWKRQGDLVSFIGTRPLRFRINTN